MNITSFFAGHIRLRGDIFKDMDIATCLRTAIEWHPSVEKIEHNPKTGSVLIKYDQETLPVKQIECLSTELLELQDLCMRYSPQKKEIILGKIKTISQQFAEL